LLPHSNDLPGNWGAAKNSLYVARLLQRKHCEQKLAAVLGWEPKAT